MKVACYLGNTRPIANSEYIPPADSKKAEIYLEHTMNRLKCFEDPKESRIFAHEVTPKRLKRMDANPNAIYEKADRVVTHMCTWGNSAKTQKCEFHLRCYTVGQVLHGRCM